MSAQRTDPRPGWQDRAACAGMDPDAFFDDAGAEAGGEATFPAQAWTACRSCPVTGDCLAADLAAVGPRAGLRAGLLPAQRDALAANTERRDDDELRRRRAVRLAEQVGAAEAAAMLGIARRTMYRWRAQAS